MLVVRGDTDGVGRSTGHQTCYLRNVAASRLPPVSTSSHLPLAAASYHLLPPALVALTASQRLLAVWPVERVTDGGPWRSDRGV